MYRHTVSDSMLRGDALPYWLDEGERVDVQGVPMVRMRHGVIVPSDGWQQTKADALRALANRIEDVGNRLLNQAASVRAQADGEAAR